LTLHSNFGNYAFVIMHSRTTALSPAALGGWSQLPNGNSRSLLPVQKSIA
jgi:hypothetical protein